ncbi:unnamed protein product [Ilex paraguariensis]|uniref:Uncharacterized protein n=1 Tax=Ilex paraguariensis TaxID=185542 RepID=A0ABC8U6R3_9AQUA
MTSFSNSLKILKHTLPSCPYSGFFLLDFYPVDVIGILPSLAGVDGDPWKNRGFFLRVSDSVHSAYVSVSEEDLDLVLSDKIQLGQFIHVTRLDSGSPVPVLRGVKPVPNRRPCVGDPKDLISSDLLQIRTRVDFSKVKPKSKMKKVEANPNLKPKVSEESKSRRLSLGNGKEEGLDLRRLSLDSGRKGWDRGPATKNGVRPVSRSKLKESFSSCDSDSVLSNKKASSEKNSSPEHPSCGFSPLKNKNVIVPQKLLIKPVKKDLKSSVDAAIPSNLIKVPINSRTWSDLKISWDSLPTTMRELGKETVCNRNVAFFTAVSALEEATAAEGVIRCLSMFAEFCTSFQQGSAGTLVEQFLDLHQSIQKAAAVIDALLSIRFPEAFASQSPLPETFRDTVNKNSTSWLQAAVQSDLSKFWLFAREDKRDVSDGDKCHYVVLESTPKKIEFENHSPQNKQSPTNRGASKTNSSAKVLPSNSRCRLPTTKNSNIEREEWSKGNGLREASNLAEKLLLASRSWFLNYLEDSLNKGFGLRNGEGGSEVAGLLGQLKRVNQWLDDSSGNGNAVNEKIKGLKNKLYGFLLEHVDSTIVARR